MLDSREIQSWIAGTSSISHASAGGTLGDYARKEEIKKALRGQAAEVMHSERGDESAFQEGIFKW